MITVNEVILDLISEHSIHHFTAFASDLYDAVPELRSGFPRTIKTSLGNRKPFRAVSKKMRDGDVLYVRYVQDFGCIELLIYND